MVAINGNCRCTSIFVPLIHCFEFSHRQFTVAGFFFGAVVGFQWLPAGWSFLKPYLGEKDKHILMVVLPLQVVVTRSFPERKKAWVQWRRVSTNTATDSRNGSIFHSYPVASPLCKVVQKILWVIPLAMRTPVFANLFCKIPFNGPTIVKPQNLRSCQFLRLPPKCPCY